MTHVIESTKKQLTVRAVLSFIFGLLLALTFIIFILHLNKINPENSPTNTQSQRIKIVIPEAIINSEKITSTKGLLVGKRIPPTESISNSILNLDKGYKYTISVSDYQTLNHIIKEIPRIDNPIDTITFNIEQNIAPPSKSTCDKLHEFGIRCGFAPTFSWLLRASPEQLRLLHSNGIDILGVQLQKVKDPNIAIKVIQQALKYCPNIRFSIQFWIPQPNNKEQILIFLQKLKSTLSDDELKHISRIVLYCSPKDSNKQETIDIINNVILYLNSDFSSP